MKIGIVCYPTFGGSGVVATELGIELSNKGHEVHFITYSQPVRLEVLTSLPIDVAVPVNLIDVTPRFSFMV